MTATASKTVDVTDPPLEGRVLRESDTYADHPDLPGITGRIQWVTPEMAYDWLLLNRDNRPEKTKHTQQLTRALRKDQFIFDAHPVRFDVDGDLMDGQHRLKAIAKSGVPALIVVWRGLAKESRAVMDSNVPRTTRDALAMSGQQYATLVASVARYIFQIGNTDHHIPGSGRIKPSTIELIDVLEAFPEARVAGKFGGSWQWQNKEMRKLKGSVAAIGWWLFTTASLSSSVGDTTTGEQFMHRIVTGDDIKPDTPEREFRKRIMASGQGYDQEPLNATKQLALLILAWGHFQRGESVTKIQSPRGEKLTNANFPWPPAYFDISKVRERLAAINELEEDEPETRSGSGVMTGFGGRA